MLLQTKTKPNQTKQNSSSTTVILHTKQKQTNAPPNKKHTKPNQTKQLLHNCNSFIPNKNKQTNAPPNKKQTKQKTPPQF